MSSSIEGDFGHAERLERVYKKVIWRLVPFIFICYIFAYFSRINVSFAKLEMLADIQLSETAYGFGAGIFFIGYVIFAVPSNIFLAKIGAKRWICILMIAWGIFSTCLMFTRTPMQFYVLRLLTGIAEAGFFPGVVYYFTRWFPGERRGQVISLFMAAIPLSGVLGGPLSGFIMDTFGNHQLNLAGWEWLFLLYGIPTILLGFSVFWFMPDSYNSCTFLTPEEKQIIAIDLQKEDQRKDSDCKNNSMLGFLFSPMVWYFCLIYFFIEMGEYAIGFWMPSIIKSSGFDSLSLIGVLSSIPYLFAGIVMIYVGRSADLHKERRWHLVIPMLVGMAGLLIAAKFAHSPVIAMIGLTLSTIGVLTSLPMFWTVPSAMLGSAAAAGGLALINSIGNLAGFCSPYLVGWIKDTTNNTDIALYTLAGSVFIGALLILRIPKKLLAH